MSFLNQLATNISSGAWWAGEVPSWFVFVVVAGLFSSWLNEWFETRRNEKYQ